MCPKFSQFLWKPFLVGFHPYSIAPQGPQAVTSLFLFFCLTYCDVTSVLLATLPQRCSPTTMFRALWLDVCATWANSLSKPFLSYVCNRHIMSSAPDRSEENYCPNSVGPDGRFQIWDQFIYYALCSVQPVFNNYKMLIDYKRKNYDKFRINLLCQVFCPVQKSKH